MKQRNQKIFKGIIIVILLALISIGAVFLIRSAIQYNQKMQFREGLLEIPIGTPSYIIVNEFGPADIYLPTGQLMVQYKLSKGRLVEMNYGMGTEIIGITEILRDGTRRYIGW